MQASHVSDPCRAQRHKIFQPIQMSCAGEAFRAHLLDLSSTGALAHAEAPPPVGARIALAADLSLGTARVKWASGKRFGIAFTIPLTRAQIDGAIAARRALVAAGTQRLAMPGGGARA
ncbi:MAG TPA: PilZ domain-containing protein [Sphingomonas sp.]|nr:PilZ domain-containing protein [Sphingomonas sp.]